MLDPYLLAVSTKHLSLSNTSAASISSASVSMGQRAQLSGGHGWEWEGDLASPSGFGRTPAPPPWAGLAGDCRWRLCEVAWESWANGRVAPPPGRPLHRSTQADRGSHSDLPGRQSLAAALQLGGCTQAAPDQRLKCEQSSHPPPATHATFKEPVSSYRPTACVAGGIPAIPPEKAHNQWIW